MDAIQSALGKRMKFHFISVPVSLFEGFHVSRRYPQQIYYRLAAPLLLPPELERILYLDVDTIIINSLAELSDRQSGYFGTFLFGVIERALIPFGLHHVFYLPIWQTAISGSAVIDGVTVYGAQNIFFAELASPNTVHFSVEATRFLTGKYPFMMAGLPGAAFAMYTCARPEKRKEAGSLLFSVALTSFLTGITEPIEFTFLFLAPALFVIHVFFAGVAFAACHILNICIGTTFSDGLIDFVLYGVLPGQAKSNWLMMLPVFVVYFILYCRENTLM